MICAGQLTREEALRIIKTPNYASEELLAYDREYFIKKLRITEKDFDDYIQARPKKHTDYRSYLNVQKFIKNHFSFLKRFIPSP